MMQRCFDWCVVLIFLVEVETLKKRVGSFSIFFKGSSSSVRFSGPLLLHRNRPGQEVFSFCQASKDRNWDAVLFSFCAGDWEATSKNSNKNCYRYIIYIYYRHGIHAFNTAPICHLFSSSFEGNPPGVLNRGNCTVEMSIQIGHRMASLSLADAEATTEKDVWRELRGFLGHFLDRFPWVGWWWMSTRIH